MDISTTQLRRELQRIRDARKRQIERGANTSRLLRRIAEDSADDFNDPTTTLDELSRP